jgi:hypothetical protein
MECFNCESENTALYYSEKFDCPHCGDELVVNYWVCNECGFAWKECGDKVIACVDIDSFFNSEDAFEVVGDNEEEESELETCDFGDYIHRCLKCNSVCYEPAPNVFVCSNPKCEFEWEVVGIE